MVERVLVAAVGFSARRCLAGLTPDTKRVHLITNAGEDKAERAVAEAVAMFRAKNIDPQIHRCNLFDPVSCSSMLDQIFTEEIRRGAHIDFNISSGSSLVGAIGYAVVSLQGQHAFYLKWFDEKDTEAPLETLDVPPVPQVPSEDVLVLLNYVAARDVVVTRGDLRRFLEKNGRPKVESTRGDGRKYAANVRVLLDRLSHHGYGSWSPKGSSQDDHEFNLQEFGRTIQQTFGHRVPPEKWNLSSPDSGRPGRKSRL